MPYLLCDAWYRHSPYLLYAMPSIHRSQPVLRRPVPARTNPRYSAVPETVSGTAIPIIIALGVLAPFTFPNFRVKWYGIFRVTHYAGPFVVIMAVIHIASVSFAKAVKYLKQVHTVPKQRLLRKGGCVWVIAG
eukprot:2437366-Rhodomonas_salina.2